MSPSKVPDARDQARAEDLADARTTVSQRAPGSVAPGGRRWHLRSSRLIGRESSLQRLIAGLDAASRSRGGLFLVSGASGIGKTRLLNELALQARGFRVLVGRCTPLTREPRGENSLAGRALEAVRPFLEWLACYRKEHEGAVSAELSAAMAVLSAYDPALQAGLAPSAVPPLGPELGRSRVLRSLLCALLQTSAVQPLLLVIDDLQWADDLTLSLLSGGYHSGLLASKVLIVAAYRTEELDPGSFGEDVPQIDLGALSMDEIGAMAKELLGLSLAPPGLSEALYHYSEGNPFFAVEYLQAFIECGQLRQTVPGQWALSELHRQPLDVSIPSPLQDLFAIRLGGLSTRAKQALELASLLGREFREELLTLIQEAPSPEDTRSALGELVARQIVESSGPGQYRFVHDQLREAQRRTIPDARRRSLHRKVAQTLDPSDPESCLPAPAVELGLHWAEAGEPSRAAAYLEAAAKHAATEYRISDAAGIYALAISQIEAARGLRSTDEGWPLQLAILGEARGDLLGWSARHHEACAQYDAILPLVSATDTLRRARLERKKGKVYWTLHDYAKAELALQRAEALLGDVNCLAQSEELREWIDIQQGFFWLHYFARRTDGFTGPVMRRMTSVVERHGTPIQKSMFYECAACRTLAADRYRYSDAAAELARHANSKVSSAPEHLMQSAEARFTLAFTLLQGGPDEWDEAIALLEQNLQTLTPIGEATLLSRSLLYLAVCWRRSDNVLATLAIAARARLSAERARLVPYVGASVACEAWVQWRGGDTLAARRLAEEACAWWARAPHAFPFQWLAKFVLLDLHCITADFSAAALVIADLLDAQQQRLPRALDASLLACAVSLRSGAEPDTLRAKLRTVLDLAQRYRYL